MMIKKIIAGVMASGAILASSIPAFAGFTVFQANPAELPPPAEITVNATPGEINAPCAALGGAVTSIKRTNEKTPLPDAELVLIDC